MRKYWVGLAVLLGIMLLVSLATAQQVEEAAGADEEVDIDVLPMEEYEEEAAPLFRNALCLDGEDDYATAPDDPSLDVGTGSRADFTIEAFFYVAALGNNTIDTLLWKQGAYGLYIIFSSSAPDRIVLRIWTGFTAYVYLLAEVNLSVGWHHVAAVFNNEYTTSQDLLALYVDGTRRVRSTSFEFTPGIRNSPSALNVGGYTEVNTASGCLDEVRISNIARYRRASYAVPTSPFLRDAHTRALWHFNEPSGSTVFRDASGRGNTLTGRNGAQTGNPSQ